MKRSKIHYTDYVNHIIRFFLKYKDGCPQDANPVEVCDWKAVESAWNRIDDYDRNLIQTIYSKPYTMNFREAVELFAKNHPEHLTTTYFHIMCLFSDRVAVFRGLKWHDSRRTENP